jgi:hypothetical protein
MRKNDELAKSLDEVNNKLESLTKELNDIQTANQRENSVTISFDDTLTKASPILRYKPDIVDKMIELKMINEQDATQKHSVELALMTMGEEVLKQILDSFAEPFEEV